jgi:hypothetical protein
MSRLTWETEADENLRYRKYLESTLRKARRVLKLWAPEVAERGDKNPTAVNIVTDAERTIKYVKERLKALKETRESSHRDDHP